ncbi:Fusaric acid resistance protein conserved region [Methylocella tundrae]|uniref:Fusaric acid resistance protein conserved region n=2 Tax=Methylocella tundrae TaxID=227605 RepID=A0A8B6M1C2_METTU|nr:Fusaric acid resistance protein conserved region [Methylocella tundrae]VTZ48173.1 Fusaric acid resistance protein conserved region [Methylocella tundrae]
MQESSSEAMSVYSLRDWVFSLKTFAAAALALYVCFWLQLPRPYWAVATVYICSQPLAGATRSKAFYRVCGTILGASMSIALVPNLANSPEILSLAISLWIACCLYFSLLDRTPRGYVFMLAGYTAALIGFPSVDAPEGIFDTAIARVEEITLGIVCASIFSGVLFPRPVGPLVAERLQAWLGDADLWGCDALKGRKEDELLRRRRLRLAADAAQLDALSIHLAFDTSVQRYAARAMRMLRLRLLMLLPILSSLGERMSALSGQPLPPGLQPLIDEIRAALREGADIGPEIPDRLDAFIAAHDRHLDARSSARDIITSSLLLRLKDLVDIRGDCRLLQGQIESGAAKLREPLSFQTPAGVVEARHRDNAGAAFAALTAIVCIGGLCLFWIATSWPDGGTAAMIAAVICCLFAAQDDPVPLMRSFTRWSAVSVIVTIVYLFGILPRIQNFELLVLALSPAFILFGLLATRQQTAFPSLALSLWTATLLALQDNYSADFAAVANSGIALLIGVWFPTLVFQLARATGAEWSLSRLLNASRAALAAAATHHGRRDRAQFAALMLDRLGLLAPFLASPSTRLPAVDVLAELRVGLNIIELRAARHGLPAQAATLVDATLGALAQHFRAGREASTPALLRQIDEALRAIASAPPSRHRRTALLGMVGIRYTLFSDAPAYDSEPCWRASGGAALSHAGGDIML